jgi:uridine kinase
MLEDKFDQIEMIKVYLDTDNMVCLNRRIKRDVKLFGVSAEQVRDLFLTKVIPCQLQFVVPQKIKAQILIKG